MPIHRVTRRCGRQSRLLPRQAESRTHMLAHKSTHYPAHTDARTCVRAYTSLAPRYALRALLKYEYHNTAYVSKQSFQTIVLHTSLLGGRGR